MPRRAALLGLLLAFLPSKSPAQVAAVGVVTLTESDASTAATASPGYINYAECSGTVTDNLSLNWTVGSLGVSPTGIQAGTTVSVSVSANATCPVTSSTTAWTASLDAAQSPSGTYPGAGVSSLALSTVLLALGLNTCASTSENLYLCASMLVFGTTYTATGTVAFDTTSPPAPALDSVSPVDSGLQLSWTMGTSGGTTPAATSTYTVVATNAADAADVHTHSGLSAVSYRLPGLTNGVTYDVVVYAVSLAGNASAASNQISGTPQPVADFWKVYKDAGGRETGGCGTGGAGALALLPLLPLAFRRRRP